MDRSGLGQVELGQPQPVAILGLQVVHDRKASHGPSDAVAAHEQLLGHDAAEAAAHAGNEPVSGAYVGSPFDYEAGGQKRSPTSSSLLAQSALACSGSRA